MLQAILPVLQFVHQQGSIHRDIKPSNIIRHRNGKFYLLDFGAVKQVASGVGNKTSGSTGIYSMGFAPPEQVAGEEVYPSTDLYVLAVTAIALVTGKKPTDMFDVNCRQWNWRSHVQVSDALANVLNKMLSLVPAQRYQSALEVMAALNLPQSSLPPSPQLARQSFSILEILAHAAFSGFEGSLIAIAVYSLLAQLAISLRIAIVIIGCLIFAQFRRWIKKEELLIIASYLTHNYFFYFQDYTLTLQFLY